MFEPTDDNLRLGIVGAGAMGGGIAQVAISAGVQVLLFDQNPSAAEATRKAGSGGLGRRLEKGTSSRGEVDRAVAGLRVVDELSHLADRQVINEAIVEDLEIKRDLFLQL